MKKIFLFLSMCLALNVSAQSYRDSVGKVTHDTTYQVTVNAQTSHDSIFRVPIPTSDTLFRGMYSTGTKGVVGNKALEDAIIATCNKLKLTHLSFYSLSGANATNLAKFFIRLRKETSVKELCATPGSGSSITTYTSWNNSHPDSSDYDCFNLEYEPWNAADVATAWTTNRTYLQQMAAAVSNRSLTKFTDYFGWWTKSPMSTQTPDTLVKYLTVGKNFFLLHDYRVAPDYNYMDKRINDVNNAAKRQGKVARIRVIFSAEPDFMQPWLSQGHTLDEAFTIVYNAFKAKNYSNVIMDGWMCFTMDFWKASQPVQALMGARSMVAPKPIFSEKNFKNKTTRRSKQLAKE